MLVGILVVPVAQGTQAVPQKCLQQTHQQGPCLLWGVAMPRCLLVVVVPQAAVHLVVGHLVGTHLPGLQLLTTLLVVVLGSSCCWELSLFV